MSYLNSHLISYDFYKALLQNALDFEFRYELSRAFPLTTWFETEGYKLYQK